MCFYFINYKIGVTENTFDKIYLTSFCEFNVSHKMKELLFLLFFTLVLKFNLNFWDLLEVVLLKFNLRTENDK